MKDAKIIDELRRIGGSGTPREVAQALDRLAENGLSQGSLIMYFKKAFPEIPLRVLLDAGGWNRVSAGGVSDEEFDQMLSPWLPSE